MRIGLTYDLRSEYLAAGYTELETAEFDRGETIDAIESALIALNHRTDRIGNVRQLVGRLAKGDRWDLVFNICEGMFGVAREAQVPAVLDAFEVPYTFADPLVLSLSLHKGLTKAVVERAGIPTARYQIVSSAADISTVELPFPLFVKPVAEGTGKGITPASIITNAEELNRVCQQLLEEFHQAVLVETYLTGREFTVGILGTGNNARVIGTMEIVLRPEAEQGVYSYANKENSEELVEYRFIRPDADPEVAAAEQISLAAWRELNGRDGGRVDIRSDGSGRPQFLEVNPLAGLHPSHSDLPMLATAFGMTYTELIRDIVQSAAERVRDVSAL
ncbi:MAG: D-alanine--D-alanine ligase [Planctomyces sp.]|jgi:D-alanine-D-alanine ligase